MNNEIREYIEEPEEFWIEALKNSLKESVTNIESAAKQIIPVNGLVIGIYFHAVTFGKIKFVSTVIGLLYIMPIILWLLSLIWSFLVFGPKKRTIHLTSETDAQKDFEDIAAYKYKHYQISFIFFLAGIVSLAFVLMHYLRIGY